MVSLWDVGTLIGSMGSKVVWIVLDVGSFSLARGLIAMVLLLGMDSLLHVMVNEVKTMVDGSTQLFIRHSSVGHCLDIIRVGGLHPAVSLDLSSVFGSDCIPL